MKLFNSEKDHLSETKTFEILIEKVVHFEKEFQWLPDDLKIISKKLTPRVPKFGQTKKNGIIFEFE